MVKFLSKTIPILFFWGIFGYVVFYIPYPKTLTQANILDLFFFLMSLFLAISFSLNIFLSNLFLSSSLALGIIFLLILKALDALNLVTSILTLVAIGLLFSYFRKANRKGLTYVPKIPKLTNMRKHNSSS